jgi:hypothetical protein
MEEAYPLAWPLGWPRTRDDDRESDRRFATRASMYSVSYGSITVARARDQLADELARLGATDIVISTNLSGRRLPADPGVAVYFKHKRRALVMAQDRFASVAGNLRSLALAVEAMRQLERHGGGSMMERAFTGFVAIAPPSWKKPWREVFGLKPGDTPASQEDLTLMFKERAKRRHPDNGGSDTLMAELNVAFREAKEELSNGAS